ncbi:MAG: hypothetical protein ACMXYE_04745 [Candidatus Woesearchaeota archaeon]
MSIRRDRDLRYGKSRNKTVKRPKTFASEESAHAYAKAMGITSYKLHNLKNPEAIKKKIRVVSE